jgi:RTX calcium-binding nonapeptide repeat (4 copies)
MSLAHNLTTDDLGRLQTLLNAGNVAEFWRVLSTDYHDTYADNAYAVIGRPATPIGEFFGTLVQRHWENTNPGNPNAYQDHFMSVGLKHATNYLNTLKLPEKLWPTTEQIEQSYRSAVVSEGLTPQTAFDGVWSIGVLQTFFGVHWAVALGIEPERININSTVFADLQNNVEANKILFVDFVETLISDEKYTILPDILVQSGLDVGAVSDLTAAFKKQPPLYQALFIAESFVQSWNTTNGNVAEGILDFISDFLTGLGGGILDFLISPAYGNSDSINANDHQIVFGFEGSDNIVGSDGKDHLYGMGADDNISGNNGADYLEGNAGNDTLIGGKGNDELKGGQGNDTYIYTSGDGFDARADNGYAVMTKGRIGRCGLRWFGKANHPQRPSIRESVFKALSPGRPR